MKRITESLLENIEGIQVLIMFGLIATISFGLGWGRSNKAQIESQDLAYSVVANQGGVAQPPLVPAWVEPTIVLLGLLFFGSVLLVAYDELSLDEIGF